MRVRGLVGRMFVLVLVLASAGRTARADDASDAPARPPTLPDLTHRDADITLEEILASVTHGEGAVEGTPYIRVERLSYEMPIARSNWYVGAAYDAALGHDHDGTPRLLSGNPELFGRGVWSSAYGLSFGGGLALVVPTKSWAQTDPAASTAYAAIAARGWDRALFDPDFVTLRPFLDVRLLSGPITVQYRQSLELAVATDFSRCDSPPAFPDPCYRFAAVGTLYVGARFSALLSAGADLIEYYRLEPSLDDDQRPYFAVGAHVRFDTRYFQPTIGLMTNIGSPLNAVSHLGAPILGAPTSFIGVHVGLSFSVPLPHSHTKEP